MIVTLSSMTCRTLQRYVDGQLNNSELSEWLAQSEYDAELPDDERDTIARIRLIVVEVEERQRDPGEILSAVTEALAASNTDSIVIASRSGSATSWAQEPQFSATPIPLQRVGI